MFIIISHICDIKNSFIVIVIVVMIITLISMKKCYSVL